MANSRISSSNSNISMLTTSTDPIIDLYTPVEDGTYNRITHGWWAGDGLTYLVRSITFSLLME